MSFDVDDYRSQHILLGWEREHAKVVSVATKSGAKATRITVMLDVTNSYTLSRLVQDLADAQRQPKPRPKPNPPAPKALPAPRLALPAPQLRLTHGDQS